MAPTISSIKTQTNPQTSLVSNDGALQIALSGSNRSHTEYSSHSIDLDSFNNELNKISDKYGISVNQIKQLYAIGFQWIEKIKDNEDKDKIRGRVLGHIKSTLAEYAKEKNNNSKITDVKDLSKFLNNEHKKARLESASKGLIVFLIEHKMLKLPEGKTIKDVTMDDISPEDLKTATEKFIKNAIQQISNKNLGPEKIKEQIEIFKTLLAGTNDADKKKFWDAAKQVLSENKIIQEALTEIVKSIASSSAMTEFIGHVSEDDLEALGLSKDKLTAAIRQVADSDDPAAIRNVLDAVFNLIETNAEVLKSCQEKIEQYKSEHPDIEDSKLPLEEILTPEELKTYTALTNLKTMATGGFVGAAEQNIDVTDQYERMRQLGVDTGLNDIENDIFKQMNDYLQEHKDEFSEEQLNSINKSINAQTDGRYGENVKPGSIQSDGGLGVREGTSQGSVADLYAERALALQNARNNLLPPDNDENFTVDNHDKQTLVSDAAKENLSKARNLCIRFGNIAGGVQAGVWESLAAAWNDIASLSVSKLSECTKIGMLTYFNNQCKTEEKQNEFIDNASNSATEYLAAHADNFKVDANDVKKAGFYTREELLREEEERQSIEFGLV